jgi:hypothetical protein
MSMIINVKQSDSKLKTETINIIETDPNINTIANLKIESDKSLINLPKHIRAKSNDLAKKKSEEGEFSESRVIEQKAENDHSLISRHDQNKSIDINQIRVNFESNAMINENESKQNSRRTVEKISSNLNCGSNNWDKRQTLYTFTERTIFDEINRAEAEKYIDNIE